MFVADALFVNYWWDRTGPAHVAAVARERAADVYMGIDVHGRGTYGGGGDGVGAALTAARAAGCSAALFAPAWVWENHPREDFERLQAAWWAQVSAPN